MAQLEHPFPPALFDGLDRSSPVPLYHQVSTALESAILDGALPAGSRIENEIALSSRLGISRPTVRQAIQTLVDKGLVVRNRGVGTQVVHGQVTRNVELTSLFEDLAASGQSPATEVLEAEVRPADAAVAAELEQDPGSEILHLRRLRSADGAPLAILTTDLPSDFADVSIDELKSRGLYQILRSRGVTIRVAKQRIGARAATAEEGRLLDVPVGSPLLTMTRTGFDGTGRAIEFGRHCYRPDRYTFETTIVGR